MKNSYETLTAEQVASITGELGQLFNAAQVGAIVAVLDQALTAAAESAAELYTPLA